MIFLENLYLLYFYRQLGLSYSISKSHFIALRVLKKFQIPNTQPPIFKIYLYDMPMCLNLESLDLSINFYLKKNVRLSYLDCTFLMRKSHWNAQHIDTYIWIRFQVLGGRTLLKE